MCLSAASSRRNKSCWVGRKALPPFVSDSFGPGNSSLPDEFGRFLCQHLTGGCSDASQPTGWCPAAFFLAEKCHRWKWAALSPPAKHTVIGRWQWRQLFLPAWGNRTAWEEEWPHRHVPPWKVRGCGRAHQGGPGAPTWPSAWVRKPVRHLVAYWRDLRPEQGAPTGVTDKVALLSLFSCSEGCLVFNQMICHNL